MPTPESRKLRETLNLREFQCYFQPVYNLRGQSVVGLEALLRPVGLSGDMVAPGIVFEDARRLGVLADLEREAQAVALRAFAQQAEPNSPLLFINFSASLLETGEQDPEHIRAVVARHGVSTAQVAIEIEEAAVKNPDLLASFSRRNHESGFLVSLDGFGTRQSSMERVAIVQPEIIKIDRSIVSGARRSPVKRAVLRSIAYLAREIGAVSLAVGVEEYDDLVVCAAEGVDLAQGFLLGRPAPTVSAALARRETRAVQHFSALARDLRARLETCTRRSDLVSKALRSLAQRLGTLPVAQWRSALASVLQDTEGEILATYVLNEQGRQWTETVRLATESGRPTDPLSGPAEPGADHSMRDYVLGLTTLDRDMYWSAPYRAVATGTVCRTVSCRFSGPTGRGILCADVTGTPES